jgi:hypothetical protein
MPSAKHSVVIDRPVSEVFGYVLDGATGPAWRPSVADILAAGVSGQVGAVTAGPARPEGRYEFAPEGAGTRVTFGLDWEPKGIKEKLMSPMVARTMPGEVRTLDNLKRVLEER